MLALLPCTATLLLQAHMPGEQVSVCFALPVLTLPLVSGPLGSGHSGVRSGRLPVAQNLRCRVRLSISVLARIHLLSLFELAGETIILQYCAQPRLRDGAGPAVLLLPGLPLYYVLHTLPGKRSPTKVRS